METTVVFLLKFPIGDRSRKLFNSRDPEFMCEMGDIRPPIVGHPLNIFETKDVTLRLQVDAHQDDFFFREDSEERRRTFVSLRLRKAESMSDDELMELYSWLWESEKWKWTGH